MYAFLGCVLGMPNLIFVETEKADGLEVLVSNL